MSVIPAPVSRVFVLVAVGLGVVAVAAALVGALVPQKLLIGTALFVFLVKGQIVEKCHKDLGVVAAVAAVAGSAWGLGAWCSFDDFSLWPGVAFTACATAAGVAAVSLLGHHTMQRLAQRAAPFSALMAVAMVLSWFFVKRGAAGVVIALVFVTWSVVSFLIQVAAIDEGDDPVGAAANIVDDVSFIAWNAFVLWARIQ